jgi:hypothetical protein
MSPNNRLLLAAILFGIGDFILAAVDKTMQPGLVSTLALIPQLIYVIVQLWVLVKLYRQSF